MKNTFKSFLVVIVSAALLAGLLTGCHEEESAEVQQSYTAGTYKTEEYGYLSYVAVETQFSDSSITGIKIISQDETEPIFELVEQQVPQDILSYQSLAVDTVSGATMSSMAVINAVAENVKKAGGDANALRRVLIEKTPGEDEEFTTDVVVVGVGGSGFMAAHNAALSGADVLAVEKGASLATTNGVKVSGPFAVDSPVLRAQNSKLTVDKAFYHMMEYTHWGVNAALVRRCLEESGTAVSQLMDIGYNFKEVDFRFETPFSGYYGGFHLILNDKNERPGLWEEALKNDDVDVMYNTKATALLCENGIVTGIRALRRDGTKITIHADAVILCTGGYIGNKEMLNEFMGGAEVNPAGGSLSTGDGINMARDLGAVLEKNFGICLNEYGGTNSKAKRSAKQAYYDSNSAFKMGVYGGLFVDAQGQRFMDEGLMCDFPMSYGSEPIVRNSPYYAIVDQNYVDAMESIGLYEYTRSKGATDDWFIGNYFKGRLLPNLSADLKEGVEEGWAYKADTIEELADFFQLESLASTIEEYNGFCRNGVDPDFGKQTMYLSEIAQPPYYIVQNQPSGWSTIGGLRVDTSLRVLNDDNRAIPGVYAAGADAGSLFSSPYYDIPGMFYGLAITSGRIAGMSAADFAESH